MGGRRSWGARGTWVVLAAFAAGACRRPGVESTADGERIYRAGVLPSGAPLAGSRLDGVEVAGADAACAQCHRRSGLGAFEGDIEIPPVTAAYLYADRTRAQPGMHGSWLRGAHVPYDRASLAAAIRDGVRSDGRPMAAMMPRYRLGDDDMRSLIAYLEGLSARPPPGVEPASLRIATAITPDVEPGRRRLVLEILRAVVEDENHPPPRPRARVVQQAPRTSRTWELDAWELTGPPETWEAQLDARYRARPVFALVGGSSDGTWAPIERFCERHGVPGWFPAVNLPAATGAFETLYFSRGVALEADLLGRALRDGETPRPARLVQLHAGDAAGRGAAAALERAAAPTGIAVVSRALAPGPAALSRALAEVRTGDALVLWLHRDELARLDGVAPPPGAIVWLSASLAGGERAPLPAPWRRVARLLYPWELPGRRAANRAYLESWLRAHRIALVDEPLQAQAFASIDLFRAAIGEMLDDLRRDYLIEWAENMIGRRAASGMFPRLGLGPGQRFASKGGYVVRFAGDGSDAIVPETEWMIP